MWAAHWLVSGYDGEHLVHLAGLHGDDPREVRDALPCALRDCGVLLPDSDVTAARIVFTQLARMYLEGAVEAGPVVGTLSWTGYPESIKDSPLGQLLYVEDEWVAGWGRVHIELAEVVRAACEEHPRIDSEAT